MKLIVLVCVVLLSAFSVGHAFAAQGIAGVAQSLVQPNSQASPVVVLTEDDGSGTLSPPKFVMYDDGTVIYTVDGTHFVVQLEPDEVAALEERFHWDQLNELRVSYTLSDVIHQPYTRMLFKAERGYASISIYGDLSSETARVAVPAIMISAIDVIRSFESREAIEWLPEMVEVFITPYEYAPEESIIWPDFWPSLDDAATRQHGERFSLYVPISEYEAIRAFLRTRSNRGAVLIDGRKWGAGVRFPLPKEEVWTGRAY